MSRPKVLVAMKLVPEIALDLLRKRLDGTYAQIVDLTICSYLFIYFRFDVEVCDSKLVTQAELMKKVPGKFGIFCSPANKIDEELIKTAG